MIQNKKRLTIGFISDTSLESYNVKTWNGVLEGAEECDANLYCFMGGALQSRFSFFSKSNTIFDLISINKFDGLVINAGSLSNFIPQKTFHTFLKQFTSIPITLIGGVCPGIASVLADNAIGIKAIMTHLINVHKYKRIAMIRGPAGVEDAEIRYQAYQEALTMNNLPFDPEIIFQGNFLNFPVKPFIRSIKEKKIDAVVAANDVMAIEAIKELDKAGFEVPGDIAVTGFDDRAESHYILKPITTVSQPAFDLGRIAITNLIHIINGREIIEQTILPTKLVVRNSCGCSYTSLNHMIINGLHDDEAESEKIDADFYQDLISMIKPDYIQSRITKELKQWITELMDKLLLSIERKESGIFLKQFENFLIKMAKHGLDIRSFNEVMFILCKKIAKNRKNDQTLTYINDLWKDSLILIRDMFIHTVDYLMNIENNKSLHIHWLNTRLISIFDIKHFRQLLINEFHHLGILSCYISLYDTNNYKYARLIVGFEYFQFQESDTAPTLEKTHPELKININPDNREDHFNKEQSEVMDSENFQGTYPAEMLIPEYITEIIERKSFIILPLVYQSVQLGFLLLEIGPRNGKMYETLAIQLSSSLNSIMHMEHEQKINIELEQRVEQRTEHLHGILHELQQELEEKERIQSQLLQAQKMEAIGRLTSSIAHDFNNILATVIGYTEALLEEEDINTNHHYSLTEIMNSSQRAKLLIKQLMAFSRKQVLKPEEINLNQLIIDMNEMLHRLMGKDITIVTSLDPESVYVKADPVQLQQVIMNLVMNARDAMPGGGTIFIETKKTTVIEINNKIDQNIIHGNYSLLKVKDEGSGMDEQTRLKIFEPFFTTKEKGRGTGLGLSTVFGIVRQSNGYIFVESELKKGTTFTIYLPQINRKVESPVVKKEITPELSLSGKENILLVEDNHPFRNMMMKMLRKLGYHVVGLSDGYEALKWLKNPVNNKIDIIITDIIMPKMKGTELGEIIMDLYKNIKILYISGFTDNEISSSDFLDKGVHLLQKPFSRKDLAKKIREILDT